MMQTSRTSEPSVVPEWRPLTCPSCRGAVVSNIYYLEGQGYVIVWECEGRFAEEPTCDYRRVL